MRCLLTAVVLGILVFGNSGRALAGGEFEDLDFWRIDCRYHDIRHIDDKAGVGFCYASAVYRFSDGDGDRYGDDSGNGFRDVHLAVGCDNHMLFNDGARVHTEMTLDRFQPEMAATPGVEVFPHGQLLSEGTYTSVLDIYLGRFKGLCYVHRMKPRFEPPKK